MVSSTFTCAFLLAANAGCAECVSALSHSKHQTKADGNEEVLMMRRLWKPLTEAASDPSNQVFYQLHEGSRQSSREESKPTKDATKPGLMRRAKKAATRAADTESSYPEFDPEPEKGRQLLQQAEHVETSRPKEQLEQMQSAIGQKLQGVKTQLMRRVSKAPSNGSNAGLDPDQSLYRVENDPDSDASSPNKSHKKDKSLTGEITKELDKTDKALLSPGLQILIGCSVTALILCFYLIAKRLLFSPLGLWASSERLDTVLKETRAKLEELNLEYEKKLPVFERSKAEDDPELLEEAEQNLAAHAKHKAKNQEIHAAAASIAEVPEKLQNEAARVQGAFKEAVDTTTERVEDVTRREGAEIYEQLKEAVEERKLPDWQPPDWMAGEDDEVFTLPPFANLVRGALAPARLARLLADTEWSWIIDFFTLAGTTIVIIADEPKPCKDKHVFDWVYGAAGGALLDFLGRSWLIRRCVEARAEMKSSINHLEQENKVKTGNGILDTLDYLERGMAAYFDTYFRHNEIIESWLYLFLKLADTFFLFWGGFAFYTSVNDIVVDEVNCEARLAVNWMHVNSFIWTLFLLWSSASIFAYFFGYLLENKFVGDVIMKLAKGIDDDTFKGFPLCLSLAESFVLTNSSSQLGMLALEVRQDLADIQIQIQKQQRLLSQKNRLRDRLQDMSIAQLGTEKEFMERSEKKVQVALGQARPLVGLLAANVNSGTDAKDENLENTKASPPTFGRRRDLLGHNVQFQDNNSVSSYDSSEARAADVEGY